MRLEGKTAIVTGAASGIGFATAALFVAEGAKVIAADLGMPELEGTVGMAADAGDEAAVKGLIERAEKEFGGLDVFFANAGISGGLASIFEQTPEDWQDILRVNLIGPFLAIKHAAPAIKERGGGSIIATASVAGIRSGAGGPAYSASKAGVIGLTRSIAADYATSGVRANCIIAGMVNTPRVARFGEEAREKRRRAVPLQTEGTAWDVAWAAVYLASDESRWVTGAALPVDGGQLYLSEFPT